MKTRLQFLSLFTALALCASEALAHGGTFGGPAGGGSPGYNGPVGGGTQGPTGGNPGGGGPGGTTPGGTGGTTGPAGGGPAPVRPGTRPTGGGGRGTTPGGKAKSSGARELDWDWWWDLNDDHFLNLKNKIRTQANASTSADTFLGAEVPTDAAANITSQAIRKEIVPALTQGIKDPYYDARAGAVIALGKIADKSHIEQKQAIMGLLGDSDKVVRESACLALGMLGDKSVVPELLEITKNTAKGKKLAGTETGDIQTRTRAFAAVAIGLIGSREAFTPDDNVVKELVTLARTKTAAQDTQVGPAIALQLIKSQEAIPAMIEMFKDVELDTHTRAHIGVALGKVGAKLAIPELLKGLDDKEHFITHSSAIALGLLASKDDKEVVAKLVRYAESAPERGTKNFCLIALGEIGDAKGKVLLMNNVKKGQYADSTFSAIALGIMGTKFESEKADAAAVIFDQYKKSKDLEKAAFAIALGLLGHEPAKEVLREDLKGGGAQDLKGHLCTALGLMNDRDAIPAIQELVKQKGDTDLRKRASIALGLLKDTGAVKVLQEVIKESSTSKGILGAATTALGYIGDRSALPILKDMVENTKNEHQDVTRAFATVALGFLGDKDDIPLLSKVHESSNYLAQTEALAELLTIL